MRVWGEGTRLVGVRDQQHALPGEVVVDVAHNLHGRVGLARPRGPHHLRWWFRVQGSGFRVQGSGFGVRAWDVGIGVLGLGLGVRIWGLGFRGWGSGFGVQGEGRGCGVQGVWGSPASAPRSSPRELHPPGLGKIEGSGFGAPGLVFSVKGSGFKD